MNDIFDAHAQSYSEVIDKALNTYGANHDFFTAHKAWLIRDVLHQHGRTAGAMDLIDVGCGVGKIHRLLASEFRSIKGVDVSDASIAEARAQNPSVDYATYAGDRLPYTDQSADLALAICVFHHVPKAQWDHLAADLMRVLRPGGMVMVIEHNPYNPVTRRIVNTCPLDKDAVLLKPTRLKRLFFDAGAVDLTARTVLSLPPVSPLLRRLDGVLGFLPFGAQYYVIGNRARETSSPPLVRLDV